MKLVQMIEIMGLCCSPDQFEIGLDLYGWLCFQSLSLDIGSVLELLLRNCHEHFVSCVTKMMIGHHLT